ncbi:MAG: DUF7453 family protein, partial [bacterium]
TSGYIPVLPRIAPDGQVAFAAFLTGPAVDETNDAAIWTGLPGGNLAVAARAGDQVPDLPAGVVFESFSVDFALISPEVGSGALGILASATGSGITTSNDHGVWKYDGGEISMVAREGDVAPGAGAGVVFGGIFGAEVSGLGDLSLRASLAGPGVTAANDEGFWTDRDGALEAFLREGDQVPDLPAGIVVGGAGQYVGTGYNFESSTFNEASRHALQANVTGPGVHTFNNEAIWREQNGALHLLAREGDPAPGAGPGVTFGGNSVVVLFSPISYNALGQSAFDARLGGAMPTTTAMFSDHGGALAPVFMPGDPAPGTSDLFGVFGGPLLGESGRIAFRSALSSGGMYPPFGIWWDQPGPAGELVALVLPVQSLPEDHSVMIIGTSFLYAFNAAGQLAFQATLEDPVRGIREALLLAQPDGTLRVVLDTANPFDVHGDGSDVRAVASFDFGGMDDAGTMAIRLDFEDGTFGFYAAGGGVATSVVAGPERAKGLGLATIAPNPFRSATTMRFDLPERATVRVDIVDVAGRLVVRLLDGPRGAGNHSVAWSGTDGTGRRVGPGVYFVRAVSDGGTQSKKIVRVD